jgi:hypothetical protein
VRGGEESQLLVQFFDEAGGPSRREVVLLHPARSGDLGPGLQGPLRPQADEGTDKILMDGFADRRSRTIVSRLSTRNR